MCLNTARLSTPSVNIETLQVWMSFQMGKRCLSHRAVVNVSGSNCRPVKMGSVCRPGHWTPLSVTWRKPFLCSFVHYKGRTEIRLDCGISGNSRATEVFWNLLSEPGKFRWQLWSFSCFVKWWQHEISKVKQWTAVSGRTLFFVKHWITCSY